MPLDALACALALSFLAAKCGNGGKRDTPLVAKPRLEAALWREDLPFKPAGTACFANSFQHDTCFSGWSFVTRPCKLQM